MLLDWQPHVPVRAAPQHDAFSDGLQHDARFTGGQQLVPLPATLLAATLRSAGAPAAVSAFIPVISSLPVGVLAHCVTSFSRVDAEIQRRTQLQSLEQFVVAPLLEGTREEGTRARSLQMPVLHRLRWPGRTGMSPVLGTRRL